MGIESNKEAYQTMKNSIGSMENRMREIYNKGYKDGIKEGINQTTQKLVSKLLDEVEADTPQTDLLVKIPRKSRESHEKDTPQTESTGSPIGDYRDGVGAWQTDCGWK